ncbi:hypothetical protein ACHHYP_02850 [Achlya hypogyna]|uniref:Cyclin C-terminal domain-containing protein n=1 Tax=Achlya hypogyna TaxID=1202772 RepID=A0A1V9Z5D6_ACHHY|nr:hypothetical protein ACHHYP_02850 [Achlya hypogyna]
MTSHEAAMELACDEEMAELPSPPTVYLPLDDAELDLADDWYTTMLHQERQRPVFNPAFHYVQTRRVLADWTRDVGEALNMEKWIVHAAIAGEKPPQAKLQLYCLCCLYIAAKYFALDADIPSLDEMHVFAHGLYSTDDIKVYEGRLLEALHWSLTALHPLHFVRFFVATTPLYNDDQIHHLRIESSDEIWRRYQQHVEFLAEMCLLEYGFQQYPPSVVATAILAVGRRIMSIIPVWREEMEALTGYPGDAIKDCYNHVWSHYVTHSGVKSNGETSPNAVSDL